MNIAIVDDLEDDRLTLAETLSDFEKHRGLHFSMDAFASAEAFLENFEPNKYAIIFMDIYMEGMNGAEAAARIRRQDASCLVIFLTTSMDFMSEAFSCHAFEYIQKPIGRERLFQVLSDALRVLPHALRYVEFTYNRQAVRLLYNDIVSVVANRHNTDITDLRGAAYSPYVSFSKFIQPLEADRRFLLINKGVLVNMDHIQGFENGSCLLSGKVRLPVRIREYATIERAWLDYTFSQIRHEF
ncbi:MAG: LytTR family DNA-binding domain-containing protein [Eubacteriales bacterium]|nr:LytTR family DNA-binding domain-containing protein [Eubacteriales bacterium]